MPAHRQRHDDGSLHLEFPAGRYAVVATERGQEVSRRETSDIDELLYWLFASAAWSRGWAYELAHRHPTQDSRRIAFATTLDAIGQISPVWRTRMCDEQALILAEHPFRDG